MAFPLVAAIGAGAALAGGALSSASQANANRTNLRIAREQMEFQERMSGSAYQRGVADLEAAGLNPALAYSQGGASSPGGASTNIQSTEAGRGITAAIPAAAAAASLQQVRAQTANVDAQTRQVNLESSARLLKLEEEIRSLGANSRLTGARSGLAELDRQFASRTLNDRVERTGFEAGGAREAALHSMWQRRFLEESFADRLKGVEVGNRLSESQARSEHFRGSSIGFGLERERNMNRAQRTWWMRNVSPFLNDATGAARLYDRADQIDRR